MKKLLTFNPLMYQPLAEPTGAFADGTKKVFVLGQCGGDFPVLHRFMTVQEAIEAIFSTIEVQIDNEIRGAVVCHSYYDANRGFIIGQHKILANDDMIIATPIKIDMWQRAYFYGGTHNSIFHMLRTMSKCYLDSFDETSPIDLTDYCSSIVRVWGIPDNEPTRILKEIANFCCEEVDIYSKMTAKSIVDNWASNGGCISDFWKS